MATAESVSAKIRNLIAQANHTTGGSSTNLTDAVSSLMNGYGTGGLLAPLKQYKVSSGHSVGTGKFVEFERNWGTGAIFPDAYPAVEGLIALRLDSVRVLLVYRHSVSKSLYAKVMSVDGAAVSIGSEGIVCTNKCGDFSAAALSSGKVLVVYHNTDTAAGDVTLLTVDGITVNSTHTTRNLINLPLYEPSVVAMSSQRAVIVYRNSYDGKAMAVNVTDSATAFLSVYSISSSAKDLKVARIGANRVMVVYADYNQSTSTVQSGVASILGVDATGTITLLGGKVIYNAPIAHMAIAAMGQGQVLLVYQDTNDRKKTKAALLSIEGTNVSAAISTASAVLDTNTGEHSSIVPISADKALVVYHAVTGSTYSKACARVLTIDSQYVTPGAQNLVCENTTGVVAAASFNLIAFDRDFSADESVDANVVMVSLIGQGVNWVSSNRAQYRGISIAGDVVSLADLTQAGGTTVRPATSNKYNVGLTKTAGSDGATVDVYCAV